MVDSKDKPGTDSPIIGVVGNGVPISKLMRELGKMDNVTIVGEENVELDTLPDPKDFLKDEDDLRR